MARSSCPGSSYTGARWPRWISAQRPDRCCAPHHYIPAHGCTSPVRGPTPEMQCVGIIALLSDPGIPLEIWRHSACRR